MASTGNVFGKDRNITYYFDEGSPSHLWTTFEKAMYRAALQEGANVANVTFQEISSPAGADLFETWVTPAAITQAWGPSTSGGTWAASSISASEQQRHRGVECRPSVFAFFARPTSVRRRQLQHFCSRDWSRARALASAWNPATDQRGRFSRRHARAAGVNPLSHYHTAGWKNGYDPGPNFDTGLYLKNNLDVAAAGIDPLEHYLQSGRAGAGWPMRRSAMSSADSTRNTICSRTRTSPPRASIRGNTSTPMVGTRRNPNAVFDTHGYLATYGDVAAANVNPLDHYHQHGWREGRDSSTGFDTSSYLAACADFAAAHVDPLVHFLQYGMHEGRSPFADGTWG